MKKSQLKKKDEYGDFFEDYGFLKRAEEHKAKGNEEYKKERFERSIKEYDKALDQLLTVAHDKSITIGKRKWNDVIVLRSTLHLNKSTCHFKLQNWQKALDETLECLMGNMREEMMFTDPHIRQKVKTSERKDGHQAVTYVENRLPRATRAKAWFRASQCYAHMDYLERAKEALAKSLEMADDQQLLSELSQHSLRIDHLEKQQKERQRKQFRGFWDKLQERGGYVDKKPKAVAQWDSLNYEERFGDVVDPDEQIGDVEPVVGPKAVQRELEDSIRERLPPGVEVESALKSFQRNKNRMLDASFEEYLENKAEGTLVIDGPQLPPPMDVYGHVLGPSDSRPQDLPPPAKEIVPPRPRKSEETSLKWQPDRAKRQVPPPRATPADVWERKDILGAQQEAAWRYKYERQRLQKDSKAKKDSDAKKESLEALKARLEALDDSEDD